MRVGDAKLNIATFHLGRNKPAKGFYLLERFRAKWARFA
jgi:hypothetical protein